MSLLGNVVGHAAATVGRAEDYLTPGAGSGTLTDVGRSIYNPDVVLSYPGAINPFARGSAFQVVNQPVNGATSPSTSSAQSSSQSAGSSSQSNPYGGDSGTSAQDAQDRANALFGIDNGLTSANDALGRLDSQANTGYGNIDKQYQDAYNRLDATHRLGNAQYQQNTTSQLNDYQANRNQVAAQARNWMEAARRTLGAQGAGGGSAARYGVPYQAQQQATQGNAAAQATNNKNIISIEQGHQKDEDAFKNNINDIQTQRDTGRQDYQSQIENQRAQLLNTIAGLTGQRTIANGGDYKAALAASSPYTSQIPAIMAKIDALAATPAVKEQQYTLNAPNLAGYNWARPQQAATPTQDPTLAQPGYVPTYDPNQQDQQQNPIYSLFGLQDPNQLQYA
jgi:hypothetical protein